VSLPQCAHRCASDVDIDDDEPAGDADFDDDLGGLAAPRDAGDDAFDFPGLRVALTLVDSGRR
jgi:hypothetical protein